MLQTVALYKNLEKVVAGESSMLRHWRIVPDRDQNIPKAYDYFETTSRTQSVSYLKSPLFFIAGGDTSQHGVWST